MLNGFTEWYDLESLDTKFFANDDCYQAGQDDVVAMTAWEAALRWALEQSEGLERIDAPITMRDVILHELGEN